MRKQQKITYTKTPWTIEIHNDYTSIESQYFSVSNDVNNDDAKRIVACVNACEGLNPEEIPTLIVACRRLIASIPLTGNSVALEYDLNEMIRALNQVTKTK